MVCALACAVSLEARAGEEPLDEGDQPVAAVQALLRQERLYSGSIDGVLGEQTVAGIRRYQILHGLRATGRLDSSTLRLMLLPPPTSTELTAADREVLRELAQTPVPDPVAESRKPIPPGEPPAVSPEDKRRAAEAAGKKEGRSKSAKHRHTKGSGGSPYDR